MRTIIYENHYHQDPKFPIIFHCDTMYTLSEQLAIHYHESVEILYFIKGEACVRYGADSIHIKAGEVVVINANSLHQVYDRTQDCKYYCLIIDKTFCEAHDLFVEMIEYKTLVRDEKVRETIEKIIEEMKGEKTYYKEYVKLKAIELLIQLTRKHCNEHKKTKEIGNTQKVEIVKEVIDFVKIHFKEPLTLEEISKHIGISKYYLCRLFKEVTHQTLLEYINYIRCDYARKLLHSKYCNVGEAARQSGFSNLSYFSKTYKKYIGKSPSEEKQSNN